MTSTRLLRLEDAPRLAELVSANREFLAPWEPTHPVDYFTISGQREAVALALERHREGRMLPHVILDGPRVVGRVTLNNIVRGAFLSCDLGYWLAESAGGHGLATQAVGEIVRIAFTTLGLHRVQAGTLHHNVRSQRVLERNGFVRFGLAPSYLRIAGRWQDHVLYQLINPKIG